MCKSNIPFPKIHPSSESYILSLVRHAPTTPVRSNPVVWKFLMLGIAAKVLRLNFSFILPVLWLLALACSQATSPPASPTPIATPSQTQSSEATAVGQSESDASPTPAATSGLTRESLRVPTEPPPDLDTSIASVSLEEVIFDTFDGGSIALSSADESTIERLRDQINHLYRHIGQLKVERDFLSKPVYLRRAMIDPTSSCLWCVNVSCWTSAGPRCTTGRYRPGQKTCPDRQYLKTPFYAPEDEGNRAIW